MSPHHIVSGIELKLSGCTSCSAMYIKELDKNNAISIRYNAAENDCQSSLIAKKKSSKAVE